jgi:hypothetical protein
MRKLFGVLQLTTLLFTTFIFWGAAPAPAQAAPSAAPAPGLPKDTILLTLILHHDQTKTFAAIKQQEKDTGFLKAFPPAGVDVVSWNIVMGEGQEVVLKLPPDKLRELLGVIERCTYGVYKSEWYITYDYKAIWEANKAKADAAEAAAPAKQ